MTLGVFVGLATLDVVQHVAELPGPNSKVTATWQGVAAGGPALNAAVTFAALGGRARLVTRVGSGPVADLVRSDLAACGVELVDVATEEYAPSVSSITVHVATGDRQIVSTDAGRVRAFTALPPEAIDAFEGADVVEVDGHHPDLARLCLPLATGIPRVLDAGRWKPQMAWLLGAVSDVVCSADFAVPGGGDVLDAALDAGAEVAAVSAGSGPLRWRTRTTAGQVRVAAVHAVDTLGAGDMLHGAYAYARAAWAGEGPGEHLLFATDIASRSCRERGTRTWLRDLRGATLAEPGTTSAFGSSSLPAGESMTTSTRMTTTMQELVARADRLASTGRRRLIGIIGAPGAGKSTLSAELLSALGPDRAVVVPMDGFHLADAELERLGLRGVKGAIGTFDAGGYAALLRRLRDQRPGEVVYTPYFDRALEQSIGSAVRVEADIPLVITEGNYLLADTGPWPAARGCLDETWYLRTDDELRLAWLIARHVQFGRTPEEAQEWVMRSDEVNARFIATTAHRADLVVDIGVG